MNTTTAIGTLRATLIAALITTGCDPAGDDLAGDADDDTLGDEDDRSGCSFPTQAPAPDEGGFDRAGIAAGGCDLMVHDLHPQGDTAGLVFTMEAVADSPFSALDAMVWARRCSAGSCTAWERFPARNGSWTDPEIGYCDVARTQPCVYRTRGRLELPDDEEFSEYHLGTRALDDDREPVVVTFDVQ
jgi:hypothetical protein